VEADRLKLRLTGFLDAALADNTGAWTMDGRGDWTRVTADPDSAERGLQKELMERASSAK
jgi:polyphosphate kinase